MKEHNYKVTIYQDAEHKVWTRRIYLHSVNEEQAIKEATEAYFQETSRIAKYVTAEIAEI